MDWTSIIIAIISTGVLTTLAGKFIYGKNEYADRLEKRIATLESRMELLEQRDMIYASAVNCAHKCDRPDEECPVLRYMDSHEMPHMESRRNNYEAEG